MWQEFKAFLKANNIDRTNIALTMEKLPIFSILESSRWSDYELLDSGDGLKFERFGPYTFIRPEVQAMWHRRLPENRMVLSSCDIPTYE